MLKETSDPLYILDKKIMPGESTQLYLDVAKLHTRTNLSVPIIIERAKKKGPVLLLMGGIHGDEVNGVEIVRRIIRSGMNKPIKGTVICIPVFNIFGYLNQSRQFPDGRDLNRMFPGSIKGSLASRFAYHFKTDIAPALDYIIDFHTGGADRINVPQVRCAFDEIKTVKLAKAFNAPFIVQSKYIPKSVRDTMHKMGKTALLYEAGKTMSFDEEVIGYGVNGTINVMKYLGMRRGSKNKRSRSVMVPRSSWIRASHSGMFHPKVRNGSFVKKKSVIGFISDPYGDFEEKVIAKSDGHILCLNTAPIVNQGDALFRKSMQ